MAQGIPAIINQISAQLINTKGFHPSQAWLISFLTTQKSTTPLPALTSTASYRILASDISQSLDHNSSAAFPNDVSNVNFVERRLQGAIVTQVLAVEDMAKAVGSKLRRLKR